ncbi:hypothetical protein V2S66_04030 [Streptomyces sp. V4-01]|uniref:Uncharacterized protein n=1 Tax=Actinacidiphila polyblastidii TaxID=3110430 RepID=A0ABU7P5R0_9ACTN|nr:hypothetical protein [Streptomyces sp. V4-01]
MHRGRPTVGLGVGRDRHVDELAERSADWIGSVLRKPVVLYVRLNEDRWAYAARSAFADGDRTIGRLYDQRLAPQGQQERLIAAGHVHGKGWIETVGLPWSTRAATP